MALPTDRNDALEGDGARLAEPLGTKRAPAPALFEFELELELSSICPGI